MRKSNLSTIFSVFTGALLLLSSCTVENTEDPKPSEIELSVTNLTPGYFDLTWDEVKGASWYYIKIEQNGEAISDTYSGTIGIQSDLITNGIAERGILKDVKAGESYNVTVTAKDYLSGGVIKAIGTKEVTMPALPSEVIGKWKSTTYVGDNWTFNEDGTVTTTDTDAAYTMTWTIEKSEFVTRSHYSTNDQINRYTYTLSADGNTLTLKSYSQTSVLTKILED